MLSNKRTAATVSLGVVGGMTLLKFVLAYLSGSKAVLSEAWHSFSDIATTSLVLVSIIQQERKLHNGSDLEETPVEGESSSGKAPPASAGYGRRFWAWLGRVDTELKVAVTISLVLLTASAIILWNALFSPAEPVAMPITTGLIFILLSFGSFFLFKFQAAVADAETSAALAADSLHSRADMAISLLTGCSLLLYAVGVDIDVWVSIAISLFIFSFSLETLVNAGYSIYRGETSLIQAYCFWGILSRALEPELYSRLFRSCGLKLDTADWRHRFAVCLARCMRFLFRWSVRLSVAGVVVFYLSTALYTINADEEGIVLRFGQMVDTGKTAEPGLHLKMPWPVDEVVKVSTRAVESLYVGNTSGEEAAMIWSMEHGDDLAFISGDDSFFLPYVVIHYRIRDPLKFFLGYQDGAARGMLENACYQAMNRTFVTTPLYDLALYKRQEWLHDVEKEIQSELDVHDTGLEIVELCLRDLHPPKNIAGVFEEVVAAWQQRERYRNEAEEYANKHLPQARSEALQALTKAESYLTAKVLRAEGEAGNHLLRLDGYMGGGEAMRRMLVLRTAEEVLKDKKKILVDPSSGISKRFLYMELFIRGKDR